MSVKRIPFIKALAWIGFIAPFADGGSVNAQGDPLLIQACINMSTGSARVVTEDTGCRPNETAVTLSTADTDTLSELNCSSNETVRWDGDAWTCVLAHVTGVVSGANAAILLGTGFTASKQGIGQFTVNASGLSGFPIPVVTTFWGQPAFPSIFSANSNGTFQVRFFDQDGNLVDPFAWTFVYTSGVLP